MVGQGGSSGVSTVLCILQHANATKQSRMGFESKFFCRLRFMSIIGWFSGATDGFDAFGGRSIGSESAGR